MIVIYEVYKNAIKLSVLAWYTQIFIFSWRVDLPSPTVLQPFDNGSHTTILRAYNFAAAMKYTLSNHSLGFLVTKSLFFPLWHKVWSNDRSRLQIIKKNLWPH
jgi:hypothetical protein